MRTFTSCGLALSFAMLLIGATSVADAASTNASPVIQITDIPLDVAKLPFLDDSIRTYLKDLSAQYQAGTVTAFVVAAGPTGSWGVRSTVPGGAVSVSLEDMARQTLEQCEFYYLMPCRIIAINNKMTTDANGGWAQQPFTLDPAPAKFDYMTIPFVNEWDRRTLRDYLYAASPKMLLISPSGFWSYKTGTDMADAYNQAQAACKPGNQNVDCSIYAVNNYVVMDFTR
jgi:hypothetical protein